MENQELNNENVVDLYNESERVERENVSSLGPDKGHGEKATMIQINSKDFGKKSPRSKKDREVSGKNSVAEQIDKILDEFFAKDGSLEVKTPTELE